MSSIKAPSIFPVSDFLDTGAKVSDFLSSGEVRAIVIDVRQKVMVVHYEDGGPKNLQITSDSIPYLLGSRKINMLPEVHSLEDAVTTLLLSGDEKHKAFIAHPNLASRLQSTIKVIESKILGPSTLLLISGPLDLESLDQVSLYAINVEN